MLVMDDSFDFSALQLSRVFTPAANDLIATTENNEKIRESRSSEVLSTDGKQRVSPFYDVALHVSSFIDFLWITMKSTKNHSIITNWRKNSTIGAIGDTSRMA